MAKYGICPHDPGFLKASLLKLRGVPEVSLRVRATMCLVNRPVD